MLCHMHAFGSASKMTLQRDTVWSVGCADHVLKPYALNCYLWLPTWVYIKTSRFTFFGCKGLIGYHRGSDLLKNLPACGIHVATLYAVCHARRYATG